MSDKETKHIGLCMAGIDEEYNAAFLHEFLKHAEQFHFKILCFYSFSPIYFGTPQDYGEKKIFDLINFDLLDGLILLGQNCNDPAVMPYIAEKAKAADVPVVSVDYPLEGVYNVSFDYEAALEQIIVHMIEEHGSKRINFIAGVKGNEYSEQRVRIFRKVLERYQLPVEEERIGYGDFWSGPTNQVMDDFFASDLPFPDTIICANDVMAMTAFDRLKQAGYRIPEDVKVTGFDGIKQALHHLPLITTSKHNIMGAVKTTYKLLTDLFAGNQPEEQIFVTSELIIGGTCGCENGYKANFNRLLGNAYDELFQGRVFEEHQISMLSHLTNNLSFEEVFEATKKYFVEELPNEHFWLCVNDTLLAEEEFSDILEDTASRSSFYSARMDLMLHKNLDEWQGIIDFPTKELLPDLDAFLKDHSGVVFFPFHVQNYTMGYAAMSFQDNFLPMERYYQFLMNISTALDVTRARNRQDMIIENLENKYVHDPMTGLFNRRGFYQRVADIFETQKKEKGLFTIMSVDLNGLKPINDTYGHADGDIAISTVGKALMDCGTDDEVCARFGGDEFVVAGAPSDESAAEDYILRVRKYLEDFNQTSGKPYQLSASIGCVCAVPNEAISLDEFISQADEKMYEEKAKHHLSRGR